MSCHILNEGTYRSSCHQLPIVKGFIVHSPNLKSSSTPNPRFSQSFLNLFKMVVTKPMLDFFKYHYLLGLFGCYVAPNHEILT